MKSLLGFAVLLAVAAMVPLLLRPHDSSADVADQAWISAQNCPVGKYCIAGAEPALVPSDPCFPNPSLAGCPNVTGAVRPPEDPRAGRLGHVDRALCDD